MGTNPYSPRHEVRDTGRVRRHAAPCDLYLPGHQIHYVQARQAALSDAPVSWGRLDNVDEAGVITVEFLDRVERYWNHRPEDIRRVARKGDKVRIVRRWSQLAVHRRFERLLTVSIADGDALHQPCSVAADDPASFGDLATLLQERDGFVVPGTDVARFPEDDPAA